MNNLRFYYAAILLFAATIFTTSCSDDDETVYYTEMGTVTALAQDNNSFATIDGDDSGISYIRNGNILKAFDADSIGQRVIYSYTLEKDDSRSTEQKNKEIKIFNIKNVLTKKMDIFNQETQEDVFGSDEIKINNVFLSKAHLNILFLIKGFSLNIPHRISLVCQEGTKPDENGNLEVELRHNSNNDKPLDLKAGYVSYTLESIPGYNDGTLKKLTITSKSFDLSSQKIEIKINDDAKETSKALKTNATLQSVIF